MNSTIVALEERVGSLKSQNKVLLQTNEETLQRSRLSKKYFGCWKKSFVDSVPNEYIEIAVKVDDTIQNWCMNEGSELAYYKKYIQHDWRGRGEFVDEVCVMCQHDSKIAPYSSIILVAQWAYFTPPKTEAGLILKELGLNEL